MNCSAGPSSLQNGCDHWLAGSGSQSLIEKKWAVSHKISGAASGEKVASVTKEVDREPVAVGVRCPGGVLFGTDKQILSPLLTPGANPRIFWLNNQSPARQSATDRIATRRLRRRVNTTASTSPTSASTCLFPRSSGRPPHSFIPRTPAAGGVQDDGFFRRLQRPPQLYALEPNGQYFGCFGKDGSLGRAELQRTEWGTKTVLEAVPLVADVIKALPH
jgi:hypothetical protein